MVLKLFADIIDALGQVAGGIKAIAKLPKAAQKSAYVGVNAMNPCLNRRDDGKVLEVMQVQQLFVSCGQRNESNRERRCDRNETTRS